MPAKKLTLTLPNETDLTAIFLNSHARSGLTLKSFSRRCCPEAGSGAEAGMTAGPCFPRS
jgi:hypothetical protein